MSDKSYTPQVYKDNGGDRLNVGPTGAISVDPLATVTGLVQVVSNAASRVARGVVAVTTAASGIATVVTGLSTVTSCQATMADDPTATCESVTASIGDQAGSPTAGSIYVKGWKTFGGTPAAMTTTTVNVNWLAIGS